MDVRNEIKALIAQNGATLKKVCEILTQKYKTIKKTAPRKLMLLRAVLTVIT